MAWYSTKMSSLIVRRHRLKHPIPHPRQRCRRFQGLSQKFNAYENYLFCRLHRLHPPRTPQNKRITNKFSRSRCHRVPKMVQYKKVIPEYGNPSQAGGATMGKYRRAAYALGLLALIFAQVTSNSNVSDVRFVDAANALAICYTMDNWFYTGHGYGAFLRRAGSISPCAVPERRTFRGRMPGVPGHRGIPCLLRTQRPADRGRIVSGT